ncbi:exported hypothetical protein [Syntrophobacter sp. SbD1]|nr:exported hypothetical protein [Syntrophobacter sp. SbD1]
MATTPSSTTMGGLTASQAAAQLKTALSSADGQLNQGVNNLKLVHQARLSQATRTAAALKAQYGANDPGVKAAEASVAAQNAAIAGISMVSQQLTVPTVQVAKTGWALQGYVYLSDAQSQPAVGFTVFLVDAEKTYLRDYGFSYTDSTGYFLINYAGGKEHEHREHAENKEHAEFAEHAATQLFVEITDTKANPVYLSSSPFQPVLGTASFQTIVLPQGGQPIGNPPEAIRSTAMPGKRAKPRSKATPSDPSSS